jgi:hypothetical protein
MAKKALCVGINYKGSGNDLNGCINDANAWADLLVAHFDFPKPDVKLLLETDATKVNIVAGLKALLAGAQSGDVLVFQNSSHGTYVVDQGSDEPDRYDEAICPYDFRHDLILDDELREIFSSIRAIRGQPRVSCSTRRWATARNVSWIPRRSAGLSWRIPRKRKSPGSSLSQG